MSMFPAGFPDDASLSSVSVHEHERRVRLGKQPDEPLVGLAFSGGGIRSATFGLGVLQALTRLGLFRTFDYLSTVSGGGYIGGWLQAALSRRDGQPDALEFAGQEPSDVRFLRGFSNYLTPRLGLFSGDTWAAVGVSVRNLVLNFTILSLSLAAPLFLPWLLVLLFWMVVSWHQAAGAWSCAVVLIVVTLLLSLPTFTGVLNMARPTGDGGWTKSGGLRWGAGSVYAAAVLPAVVAIWFASGLVWVQARQLDTVVPDGVFVALGAAAYAGAWLVGLIAGYVAGRPRRPGSRRPRHRPVPAPAPTDDVDSPPGPDAAVAQSDSVARALVAGLVLILTASAAGAVGMMAWLHGGRALLAWLGGGAEAWRWALLLVPLGVGCFFLTVTVHLGLAGRRMSEDTREWWGRVGGVQLLLALLLSVVGGISLAGPHLPEYLASRWQWFAAHSTSVWTVVGAAWALLTGAGVAAGRSPRTSGEADGSALAWIGIVAPVVFVVGYLLIVSGLIHHAVPVWSLGYTVEGLEHTLEAYAQSAWAGTGPVRLTLGWGDALGVLGLCLATAGAAFAVSWVVDLNEFSLHMFYRNRLVRCFLGASRERNANPFTGFDSDDDVPLTAVVREGQVTRPYPIFNTALNLVGGRNLAWQQRKAASFVFTPDYCGFEYRTDEQGEGEPAHRRSAYAPTGEHAGDPRSLTLGLAVATSGAAASPNMGYHSSPTLSFLMTVFNVRLGWWLRNPATRTAWRSAANRLSLRELLYELLGLTTDSRSWVYLSDGGHFENLGIYELVRRRCRFIVVCDAGEDGQVTFGDLGNAIEKCRADFGVDIEIDVSRIRPGSTTKLSEWHCAIGRIRYDRQDQREVAGTLLYIKSSLTGDEPADVLRYAAEHPAFPHEPTSDQFFDESQFESYRALGFHVASDVFGPALGFTVGEGVATALDRHASARGAVDELELFTRLGQVWSKPAPAPPHALQRYSTALKDIWTTVRTTPALRFLDDQMFPAMPSLTGVPAVVAASSVAGASGQRREVNYWLPPSDEERRAGFYVCNEMLQLMEDVFLEFDLDQYYDHIDNRGWMNLFQHWAWSGMVCATWAITGSTFDPRFQRFCKVRLDLQPGRPGVVPLEDATILPTGTDWRARSPEQAQLEMQSWQARAGLNFWEAELVAKFLRASRHAQPLRLFPVVVTVESPRRSDGNPLRFNVGYLIGDFVRVDQQGAFFSLHYMRIQNHVRKMGLARESLKGLSDKEVAEIMVARPNFDERVANGRLSDEGLPLPAATRYIERLVRSLPRQQPTRS